MEPLQQLIPLMLTHKNITLDVVIVNRKALNKTIETKKLWILHLTTHKVVCKEPQIEVSSVFDKTTWAEAITPISLQDFQSLHDSNCNTDIHHPPTSPNPIIHTTDIPNYNFLHTLYTMLIERKETMPHGSYSTYLFSQGIEKIKKKIGEEAIELILAQDQDELCNETADLLYHIWVYFVSKHISPQKIIDILYHRFKTSQ